MAQKSKSGRMDQICLVYSLKICTCCRYTLNWQIKYSCYNLP